MQKLAPPEIRKTFAGKMVKRPRAEKAVQPAIAIVISAKPRGKPKAKGAR